MSVMAELGIKPSIQSLETGLDWVIMRNSLSCRVCYQNVDFRVMYCKVWNRTLLCKSVIPQGKDKLSRNLFTTTLPALVILMMGGALVFTSEDRTRLGFI